MHTWASAIEYHEIYFQVNMQKIALLQLNHN